MKTAGALLTVMVVAYIYVWDVAGARGPMDRVYTAVATGVRETVRDMRGRVPEFT